MGEFSKFLDAAKAEGWVDLVMGQHLGLEHCHYPETMLNIPVLSDVAKLRAEWTWQRANTWGWDVVIIQRRTISSQELNL